jgi:hypothetical protein
MNTINVIKHANDEISCNFIRISYFVKGGARVSVICNLEIHTDTHMHAHMAAHQKANMGRYRRSTAHRRAHFGDVNTRLSALHKAVSQSNLLKLARFFNNVRFVSR